MVAFGMKVARSNLLGEFVDASQVEHADTHGFQIVCPCCDESVFKVARPLGDGRLSQFFSHRQANPMQIAECEMRVGSLGNEERTARNAEARGQTMSMFQSHLREALALDAWVYGTATPACLHKRMLSRPLMRPAMDVIFSEQKRLGVDDIFEDEYRQAVREMERHGVPMKSSFAEAVQKRIARDMFAHLLTDQGRANHAWLLRHTSMRLWMVDSITEAAHRGGLTPRDEGYPPHIRLLLKSMHTKNPRIARDLSQKGYAESRRCGDTDGFYRVLTMAMVLDVMRIPYAEMLANHRAGLPKLRGVQPRKTADARGGIASLEEYDQGIGARRF